MKQERRALDRTFSGSLANRIRHARRVAKLSQADLAKAIGVGPSAVAQWELPSGTSPRVDHLIDTATLAGVSFEWLATGRGSVGVADFETPAIEGLSFAKDQMEDRLLAAFRRIPTKRREAFVHWMEVFF